MSATDAAPTPTATARRRMTGASRSRWAADSVLESRTPSIRWQFGGMITAAATTAPQVGATPDLVHARRSGWRRRATGGAPSAGWGRSRPSAAIVPRPRAGGGPRWPVVADSARMQRPFAQVDVFTTGPGLGNAARGRARRLRARPPPRCSRFARWTNLSETTFVLPPDDPAADYRVRIFTPGRRAAVRGPPDARDVPRLARGRRRAARAGPRRPGVRRRAGRGPPDGRRPRVRRASPAPLGARGRGGPRGASPRRSASSATAIVDAQWGDNGPGWVIVLLESAEAVLAIRPGAVAVRPRDRRAPPARGRRRRSRSARSTRRTGSPSRTPSPAASTRPRPGG